MARINQLDALRGLAAFSVVLGHCIGVGAFPLFTSSYYENIAAVLTYSPLRLFWAAHEAVILFFVLSGFVLSLPYFQDNQLKYSEYITKRFFRIYIPYIVSIAISALLLRLLSEHGVIGLSDWFNGMWKNTPDIEGWINLIFMLNTHEAHNINTTTWTLVYEMHISIVFPLIVYYVKKTNWKFVAIFSLFLLFTKSNFLHYSFLFILGALLAKYRDNISLYFTHSKGIIIFFFISMGVLLYLFESLIPLTLKRNLLDFLTGIGAAFIIAVSLGENKLKAFFLRPYLIYLGRISYSLYLVHPIVLLTAVYSLKNLFPIYVIVALVPPVSIVVAHFYFKVVEHPAIALGRKLILKNIKTSTVLIK